MSKIIGVTVGTPLSASVIKEKIKPVTSVNGVKADESGNVNVAAGGVDVQEVVEAALAEAKASGAFDGKDGYTPINGVDYYTQADKDEMVAAVIAALPVYNGEVQYE